LFWFKFTDIDVYKVKIMHNITIWICAYRGVASFSGDRSKHRMRWGWVTRKFLKFICKSVDFKALWVYQAKI